MRPSTSQSVVPVLSQSFRNARGKHERRLIQDGSCVALAGPQEPLANQTLSDAVSVVLDNRHKSCYRGPAIQNLNLATATDLADIT